MSSLGSATAVRERVAGRVETVRGEAVRVGPGRAVTAPPPSPPGMRRHLPYTLPGLWFALLFTCLSFTPSLLPRSALVQGLVCGINAAIGYGLGVFAAAAWRAVVDRDARPARPASWMLLVKWPCQNHARRACKGRLLTMNLYSRFSTASELSVRGSSTASGLGSDHTGSGTAS